MASSHKPYLLLIDGHALLYRSFHALPPLRTKDGVPTNAVYGFVATILKAFEDFKPTYCAVAFDLSGPTFRHAAFEGYKASRKPTPDDLQTQIPLAYEVTEALNIPIFTKEGYEADDVIGTLTRQANEQDIPVIIVTGDRDAFQLVNDKTTVFMMRKVTDTAVYDASAVRERMGVDPDQIREFKALAGDSSDEIPGVAGIGEKTAVMLLQQSRTIDELYDRLKKQEPIEGLSERLRTKLIEGEQSAKQSRELATIDSHVAITLDLDACVIHEYDATKVHDVFKKLEFFSLGKRLPSQIGQENVSQATQERDWTFATITTETQIEDMVKTLHDKPVLAVDTETDNLHGPIIGISISGDRSHGFYIPLVDTHGATLPQSRIVELIKPLLENNTPKVGHNIKYDIHALANIGIKLQPITFDTMVASYILQSHMRSFDFDTVAGRELGYTPIAYSDVVGSSKKDVSLLTAPGDKVSEYAAEDAIITLRLFHHFSEAFSEKPAMSNVAETIDFPLIHVLAQMERRGVCLDSQKLKHIEIRATKELDAIRDRIQSYAPEPININSPAQLQTLLFETLKLDKAGMKSTQKGTSTAAAELEKLQGLHPVIDDILKYRELSKLLSTYILTLPKLVDNEGRLHTKFSQTTAATGRLSSNDPNLQNIPIRTELGNEIRKAFVAPKGFSLLSLDYSQIELRIIAHLSNDQKLIQVFKDGRDIHDEVAKALHVDRRAAKAINFGIIYGLSAFGLSQGLKIEQKTAKAYIDAYFAEYPDLHHYLLNTRQQVKDVGYVETLYGRRREIPEIYASNAIVRAAAERQAINAPAQGTAADIMKIAMIRVHDWIEKEYDSKDTRPYLVLQVHDELLLEVPEGMQTHVAQHVKHIMESVEGLNVPLEADVAMGDSWGELDDTKL